MKKNPRRSEYLEYLHNHIENVKKSWGLARDLLGLGDKLTGEMVKKINRNIDLHDESKYSPEEFSAYCNYFYPCDGFPKNKEEFDEAWIHHYENNPHHPEYWDGDDMPLEYIIEMLCDWHSFSLKNPRSTAFNWYLQNKDKWNFSNKTRKLIEEYIHYFKWSLSEIFYIGEGK